MTFHYFSSHSLCPGSKAGHILVPEHPADCIGCRSGRCWPVRGIPGAHGGGGQCDTASLPRLSARPGILGHQANGPSTSC